MYNSPLFYSDIDKCYAVHSKLSHLQVACTMFILELLIPGLNTPLGEET